MERFDALLEAQVVIEDRRAEYNTVRTHSSLGWRTPAQFTAAFRKELQPV